MITAEQFTAPGRPTLVYDDFGDGGSPPVVLLHGGTASRAMWADPASKLATERRVLAPDLRGHGESDRAPGEYDLAHFTADIEAFVEQVAGQPAVLAGHSLGAMVAAHLASSRPDLVDGAFLIDPPIYIGSEGFESMGFAAFFPLLQRLLDDFRARQGTVEELVALIRSMQEHDRRRPGVTDVVIGQRRPPGGRESRRRRHRPIVHRRCNRVHVR